MDPNTLTAGELELAYETTAEIALEYRSPVQKALRNGMKLAPRELGLLYLGIREAPAVDVADQGPRARGAHGQAAGRSSELTVALG